MFRYFPFIPGRWRQNAVNCRYFYFIRNVPPRQTESDTFPSKPGKFFSIIFPICFI
jgi:hypothetical protein